MAGVTKRTIDHYSNLGLLEVERSPSNYRYYTRKMVERIHWIEEQKSKGYCLEQIAQQLKEQNYEEVDIQMIRLQMRKLEKDVSELLEHLDERDKQVFKSKVSPESIALLQSLLLLTNN